MDDVRKVAQKALGLVDLTDLTDNCTPAAIDALCSKAQTDHGPVAAICIWPQFIEQAVPLLSGTGIDIATVVNFPHGGEDTPAVIDETERALKDGATEIDLVMPYRAFAAGRRDLAEAQIREIRSLIPEGKALKVILETGELTLPGLIRGASDLCLQCGADFIKTSTGKVATNATPEAAKIMITAIHDSGKEAGFKAAGGIRTTSDAVDYLAIADEIMGADWASKSTFRFGASGLLDALLATINGEEAAENTAAY